MSSYTDYESVSINYDKTRIPFGLEEIIEIITTATGKSLQLHVLDAGCGTGNYTLGLLKAGVGKISMFDASTGMLSQARKKLEPYSGDGRIVAIEQGLLPSLPFDNDTFDAVMFNMVLHHLVDERVENRTARFESMVEVFEETARILKPGGVLVFTTCLPEQYLAIWYANILPHVTRRMENRFPTTRELTDMLLKCDYYNLSIDSILGDGWTMAYWVAEGPLKKEWRNLDSYWSIFTEDEINEVAKKTEAMKGQGTLYQFMVDNDASKTVGHFSIGRAIKADH